MIRLIQTHFTKLNHDYSGYPYLSYITMNLVNNSNLPWGVPWSKMISSRMVMDNKISFEEVMWCNDERFSFYCSYYAGDNVDKSDVNLYYSTMRKKSLVHRVTVESLMCRMAVVIRVHKIAHKLNVGYYSMGFSYMQQVKPFGRKAYIRAIIYYITYERLSEVMRMFIKVAKFNIKRYVIRLRKIDYAS